MREMNNPTEDKAIENVFIFKKAFEETNDCDVTPFRDKSLDDFEGWYGFDFHVVPRDLTILSFKISVVIPGCDDILKDGFQICVDGNWQYWDYAIKVDLKRQSVECCIKKVNKKIEKIDQAIGSYKMSRAELVNKIKKYREELDSL